MRKIERLPRVVILYGPPGSGKNTQAELLVKRFSAFTILDYGSELRSFVAENKEKSSHDIDFVHKIEQQINKGEVLSAEDLMTIVSTKLFKILDSGKSIFLIGPGRVQEEARLLAQYLGNHEIHSCVLHLHLSLDDILERLSHRYFVTGSDIPYASYQEAKNNAPKNTEPYQRADDSNTDKIINRYRSQYKNKFSSILFTFQLHASSHVFLIDASQSIEKVHSDVLQILECYYQTS